MKKLCDGCKVSGLSCMPFEGKSGELSRLICVWVVECEAERICVYYMLEESEA